MTTPRDESDPLDGILYRVWCAALDARVILAEEGGTEAQYLQKQRYHIERAKAEIRAVLAAHPEDRPTLLRVGGYAIGFVAKQPTARDDGRFVYEVEPLPQWKGLLPTQDVAP